MSGNMSRRKGARAEVNVAAWLQLHGYSHVERAPAGRSQDGHGDLLGLPGLHVECKAHREMNLAGWVDQATRDAHDLPWLLVVKRRGRADVGQWYAVQTLTGWEQLARQAGLITPTITAPPGHHGKEAMPDSTSTSTHRKDDLSQ